MGPGRQAQAIKLSREDRKSLELLTRRSTAEHREVIRAQIALMAHAGETTTAISQATGVSVQTVSHWRTRLARHGVRGLQEVARPGRPRRIDAAQRLELLSLACEPAEAQGRSTPTLDELVERAIERGVVTQLSRSHLQRILQAGDLRPHRVRQWLHSPDPQFRQKVNAICALYRQAPKGSVVLSVDEKTGIQALQRKHADRVPGPGRTRRREFEYVRHGTQALIAALDVHTGRVMGRCTDRRTQADLVAFMEQVEATSCGTTSTPIAPRPESSLSFMTPPNPADLSKLKKRGAKVMAYHGTSDPIFSSDDTQHWYDQLRVANGGDASNFARFYRVPGMNHCSGGPTTDQFDMLTPLVNWVEKGQAADLVVASARGTGNIGGVNADVPAGWAADRTRPLCAYPKVARYKGSGDIEKADSFSCQ
jgi:transposase